MNDNYARIGWGSLSVMNQERLINVPLPIITLGAPGWRGLNPVMTMTRTQKPAEVGVKLHYLSMQHVSVVFSVREAPGFGWVPTEQFDLTVIAPHDAEMRTAFEMARDGESAAVDLVNTADGQTVRMVFRKVREKVDQRIFYYVLEPEKTARVQTPKGTLT